MSGGERKRAAIGSHIVHDPRILFLDEPTSGLDSSNALRVVKIVKDVAVESRSIVIMVIHQVREEAGAGARAGGRGSGQEHR